MGQNELSGPSEDQARAFRGEAEDARDAGTTSRHETDSGAPILLCKDDNFGAVMRVKEEESSPSWLAPTEQEAPFGRDELAPDGMVTGECSGTAAPRTTTTPDPDLSPVLQKRLPEQWIRAFPAWERISRSLGPPAPTGSSPRRRKTTTPAMP